MTQMAAPAAESELLTSPGVRLLGSDDWQDLQFARLEALRDSPDAFVATLADVEARKPEDWIASIKQSVWAGVWENGRIVGTARLSAAESVAPTRPFIESVWVTQSYRRRGLVRDMLQELERCARRAGATYLQLWVLEDNVGAFDAYLKLDFSPVPGRTQKSQKRRGDGAFVPERLMGKQLW